MIPPGDPWMQQSSFQDFLREWGALHPPELRYEPGGDFAAWRSALLGRLGELLGPVPPRVEPTLETLSSEAFDGYVRHEVSIAVSEGVCVPGYLLLPDDLAAGERRPGVVALHGHIAYGPQTVAGVDNEEVADKPYRAVGLHAVRSGYVVLAPACWGWPGRDGHVGEVPAGRDKCNAIEIAAQMYGLNLLALHLQDAQACLDLLARRPEVDADRLGCIGNSTGGRMAMWLAALDERVGACVAAGCLNTFRERSLKLSACGIQYPPGLLRVADVPEVFAAIAPRALQLQADYDDEILNRADIDAIHATVRSAYDDAGAGDRLDFVTHEQGHRLVWDRAEAFLRRHLGGV